MGVNPSLFRIIKHEKRGAGALRQMLMTMQNVCLMVDAEVLNVT